MSPRYPEEGAQLHIKVSEPQRLYATYLLCDRCGLRHGTYAPGNPGGTHKSDHSNPMPSTSFAGFYPPVTTVVQWPRRPRNGHLDLS